MLSNGVESFLLQNGRDHVSCFEALVGVWLYHEVALAAASGRVEVLDDQCHLLADELAAESLLQLAIQFVQYPGAFFYEFGRYRRLHPGGGGALAGAETEDVGF